MKGSTQMAKGKWQISSLKTLVMRCAFCRGRTRFGCLYLAIFLVTLGASGAAQRPSPTPRVSITSRVDKTAVWIGDALNYTIEVIHDSDIEFVLDNLNKESLRFAPFVIREITTQDRDWTDTKRLLEINFLLSTYEIGKNDLTIPSLVLYYFKRETGLKRLEKKDLTAEAVRVPALKVGFRSTLTGSPLRPRDFKPNSPIDVSQAIAALVLGLTGITFTTVQGMRKARELFRRKRPAKIRLSSWARAKSAEKQLANLQALGRQSPEDLLRFYAEAPRFLRQYVSERWQIEAAGLTPDEIEIALGKANVKDPLVQEIKTVLEQCDRVRYGRDSIPLARDLWTQAFTALERIVRSNRT